MFTDVATEMVCVHNMLIRGLNAIYLQAPSISPKDEQSFLHFTEQWLKVLHSHHHGEEEDFFPLLERLTGEKGIMDANVEQHHAFEKGVSKFETYICACLNGTEKYNGIKVTEIVDEFGLILREHLADEIPTLLGLRRFGDKLACLKQMFEKEGEKHMKEVGMFSGAVWCLAVHDFGYENGIHRNFPPAPGIILWVLRNLAWWLHSDWWKFAPCDRQGELKPLYASARKSE
jgi:hypothetical protein